MDEALLEKRDGAIESDNETTRWTEYWLDGELVHRSVHVTLRPQAVANALIGEL